jgi:hypothetical protein
MDLKAARRELIRRQRLVIGAIAHGHRKDENGVYYASLEQIDEYWKQFDELYHMLKTIEDTLKGDYD